MTKVHIKKLWPYLKPYKVQFFTGVFLGGVMSFCQGSVPPLGAFLFDKVFLTQTGPVDPQMENLTRFFSSLFGENREFLVVAVPAAMVFLFLINGICRYFHFTLIRLTGERLAVDLQQSILKKYLHLDLSFHNNYNDGSGGLLSRSLNDVMVLQYGIQLVADVIREPLLAGYLLFSMLLMDWKLTICTLIVAPLISLMLRQIARSLRKYGHNSQQSLERHTSNIKESLDGVKIIQSFNLENTMRDRLKRSAAHFLSNRQKIIGREEIAGPVSEFIGACTFAAMSVYIGYGVLGGRSSAGVFVGFVVALGFFQKPVKKLQGALVRLQQTIVAVERIFQLLGSMSSIKEIKNPKPFPKNWSTIEYRNVSFKYGVQSTENILKNISFTVRRGEVIALVGESGSGKSTLVNLLERFFDPSEGEIFIDAVPIKEFSIVELRQHISLVTQDVYLFNESVANNIAYGDVNNRHFESVERAAQLANAHHFINAMPNGFKSGVGERGGLLSGGERQRISIARALFKNAPILILDEATSALDSVSEIEVQKGLDHLMQGRTTFVIAHRLSTVARADRIFVLSKGQIVEAGTHEYLLAQRGSYYQFHLHQFIERT